MSKMQHPYPIGTPVYTVKNEPEVIPGCFTEVIGYVNHPITGEVGYEVSPPVRTTFSWNADFIICRCVRAIENPGEDAQDEMISLHGKPVYRDLKEIDTCLREIFEDQFEGKL